MQEVYKWKELTFPVKEGLWKPKAPADLGDYRMRELGAEDADLSDDDDLEDITENNLDEAPSEHTVKPEEPSVDGVKARSDVDPAEYDQDRWEVRGNYVVRIHNNPRRKLFAPYGCDDAPPCDVECLEPSRTTIANGEENE